MRKIKGNLKLVEGRVQKLFVVVSCFLLVGISLLAQIGEKKPLVDFQQKARENRLDSESVYLDINRLKIRTWEACFHNNLAFLLTNDNEIHIFDINKPRTPNRIGFCVGEGFSLVDIVANDHYLFTAKAHGEDDRQIHTIDISNPKNPQLINQYKITGGRIGEFTDMAITEGYLFLTFMTQEREQRLEIYNCTTGIPKIIMKCTLETNSTEYRSHDIFLTKNYAFISMIGEKIVVLDIRNLTNIRKICEYSYQIAPNDLIVDNDYVYVADRNLGLMVFSFSSRDSLERIYQSSSAGNCEQVIIANELAIAYQEKEIRIFDIADPEAPALLAQKKVPYEPPQYYTPPALYTVNDILSVVIIKGNSLLFYKISSPTQIRRIMNWTRFWGYFGILLIALLVPGYTLIAKVITTKQKTKESKVPSKAKTANTKNISKNSAKRQTIFSGRLGKANAESSSKMPLKGEMQAIYDECVREATYLKPYRFALMVLIAQNVSFVIFIPLAIIIGAFPWPPTEWAFYLVNIPLTLDLIAGVIFTIVSVLDFRVKKNSRTIIAAIFWLLWVGIALGYRLLVGMPSYMELYNSVYDYPVGYKYNYQFLYILANLFTASLVLFWFALHFTDKSLAQQKIMKKAIPLQIFGSANLFVGVPIAYRILLDSEPQPQVIAVLVGLYSFFFVLAKIFLVPILGFSISRTKDLNMSRFNLSVVPENLEQAPNDNEEKSDRKRNLWDSNS